jgi:hypothetical protein
MSEALQRFGGRILTGRDFKEMVSTACAVAKAEK